jgi:electron transfer flavoprotein beta subunit
VKIVVLVKVVPEKIFFDPASLHVKRSGNSIINPLDLSALREAVKLKRIFNDTSITVISMAPSKEEQLLKTLFYYEVDRVIQLSDIIFAESDVFATAFVLGHAIRNLVSGFDMVLGGDYSTDGLTGQLVGEVAAQLNLPFLTGICKISMADDHTVLVERKNSANELEKFSVKIPSLLACDSSINEGISPNLSSILDAEDKAVELYDSVSLGLKDNFNGIDSSKTFVSGVEQVKLATNSDVIRENWLRAFDDFVERIGGVR